MKFKNYRNSKTDDNRIYTTKEIKNMTLGEIFRRKDEILAQNRAIGIPSESELRGSDNVVYVHEYEREDGTRVRAHWRSKNGGGIQTVNNTQNKTQMKKVDNNDDAEKTLNQTENITTEKQDKSDTQKDLDKKLYPDEIAGVKRGEPMTLEEVIKKGVNPTYEQSVNEGVKDGNCNDCVAACEYCRRGYDVNAESTITNSKAEELSKNGYDLWLNPYTGDICEWSEINTNEKSSYEHLMDNINPGEHFELSIYSQLIENDPSTIDGHVVYGEKTKDNQIKIYDPQKREIYLNNDEVKMYLNSWIDAPEAIKDLTPKYLRIDNKQINPYYLDVLGK